MVKPPYKIARQEHLGDILDELQSRDRLHWQWKYDRTRSTAIYRIEQDGTWRSYGTREAEAIAQAECDALGIIWTPVKHPGGENQRAEALTWIHAQLS